MPPVPSGGRPIDRSSFAAFAPPVKVEVKEEKNVPGSKQVDPEVLQAFRAPKESASNQTIMVRPQKPIGECPHPFARRWVMGEGTASELEGCLNCGLANNRGKWQSNEMWVMEARKAGVFE